MTCNKKQLRLGRTAIAAVLAFSSTPLFAQAVGSPPVVTLPTPAPPIAAQTAPAAPANRVLAAPTMEPVTNVPASRAEAPSAPTRRTATSQARIATPARSVSRAAAPAAAAPAPATEPAAATAPAAPFVEAPVVAPLPTAAEPVTPVETTASEGSSDVLPIAGGAAALLALAGGAYALSRRRRDDEVEPVEAESWESEHAAFTAAPVEPAWAAPERAVHEPVAAPAQIAAAAAIPAGIDLSRYGRHTQAAYRGPTPDNPSLSLKRRLKRAAFFDQRERMASEAAATPERVPAAVRSDTIPAPAPKRSVTVTSRRVSPQASTQALFGFRPALQH